ncbi:hypothetical protein ACFC0D_26690 [Streptomyces sp. NPDC056222]|uniref:hypothetical protein n=1 Tax=Streptomyces sp. NPDC056222 TaxID=3345749 RepID=UPI0035E0C951
MTDFHDEPERRAALRQSVEARFGQAGDWTLKLQAAYAQLETMHKLMGDDYAPFVALAQEAVHRQRDRQTLRLLFRRDHLSMLLRPRFGEQSLTADVGWALNIALESLLTEDEYEQIIDAAVEATQPTPVSTH